MNWKQKARLQNLIAELPADTSAAIYYALQHQFGGLRDLNPTKRLAAGISAVDCSHQQGHSFDAKTILEIGTGRRLCLPIAWWLCGASKIITVDLNPDLKAELVLQDVDYIRNNQQKVKRLFGKYAQKPIFIERFNRLLDTDATLNNLLRTMNIDYLPAEGTDLPLAAQSVDYHISHGVFEHVLPQVFEGFLWEGRRLLKRKGLFIHGIDFSDHFSHSDSSISPINFLKFSESQWEFYAGNRYMYQNRLRIDDCLELFAGAHLQILAVDTTVDEQSLKELQAGFYVNKRFRGKTDEVNATTHAWIVASPR